MVSGTGRHRLGRHRRTVVRVDGQRAPVDVLLGDGVGQQLPG
jgi:hypothetical protein